MSSLSEIEATLRAEPPELRERIVRGVGIFTVALFGVFEVAKRLQLAGTGTLVTFAGCHYILTAAHVWEKVLKSADGIGITLKENMDHRHIFTTTELLPFGPPKPDTWNEWGPDLMFLRIPRERIGAIEAYRTFYNLTIQRPIAVAADHVEVTILMGAPAVLGKFTQVHADIEINGLFTCISRRCANGDYDYVDLDEDVSLPGTPKDFGGVSGGGLWKVQIYNSPATNKIDWVPILEGVAFYQFPLADGHRVIRCHGLQSIQRGMSFAPANA